MFITWIIKYWKDSFQNNFSKKCWQNILKVVTYISRQYDDNEPKQINTLITLSLIISKFINNRVRLNFLLRVWSWLRTNAGGVLNTCKSNEWLKTDFLGKKIWWFSGERVSNTWETCLSQRDSHRKRWLIPHDIRESHDTLIKDLSVIDGPAAD